MRSALMASIYDKALRRKDFSGVIDKDKVKEAHKVSVEDASAPCLFSIPAITSVLDKLMCFCFSEE